jgi:hypothetical protein
MPPEGSYSWSFAGQMGSTKYTQQDLSNVDFFIQFIYIRYPCGRLGLPVIALPRTREKSIQLIPGIEPVTNNFNIKQQTMQGCATAATELYQWREF